MSNAFSECCAHLCRKCYKGPLCIVGLPINQYAIFLPLNEEANIWLKNKNKMLNIKYFEDLIVVINTMYYVMYEGK